DGGSGRVVGEAAGDVGGGVQLDGVEGGAVDDGGGVGPNHDWRALADSEGAIDQSDGVVGMAVGRVHQGWHDGVGSERAARRGGGAVGGGDVVAVGHAQDRAGEDGIGLAISPV